MSIRASLNRLQEWKSYQAYDEAENSILELADLLSVKDRPELFRVLPCLGVFRDREAGRIGLIFQPPPFIEQIPRSSSAQGSVSGPRMPKTLHDLLEQASVENGTRSNILPLGDRFRLACSLAQSLYAMHAIGWVHKKYEAAPLALTEVLIM